jgi:hypothetical protein
MAPMLSVSVQVFMLVEFEFQTGTKGPLSFYFVRETRGGHLIEQRLEQVVILPVTERDPRRAVIEPRMGRIHGVDTP